MNKFRILLVLLPALASAARAQDATADAERAAQAEERENVVSIEEEMRAAEVRLEEAARRIAELSTRRLPRIDAERYSVAFAGRPMLGITIDGDTGDGPVEGAAVRGVTPGGPAFEAGVRAGDVITSINGEAMSADSGAEANRKLLDFMSGVEEGDTLDIEYLRDGKVSRVSVTPETRVARSFAFTMPGVPHAPRAPRAVSAPTFSNFVFLQGQGGWGDMEMVTLTADLGRYFGTDKGLLVVRAPADEDLKLKDGDVIHAIDGREPSSVSHAVRILGSYQAGESLKIDIMRDKRRQTLEVEMPDDRQGALDPLPAPRVVVDVAPRVDVDVRANDDDGPLH